MTGLSPFGEDLVLNPLISTAFVSLHTGDPGNAGASEVAPTGGTNYGRQSAAFTKTPGGTSTVAANTSIVTYSAAGASWGTITHFGIWDAASGGNFRGGNVVNTPKTVNVNDTARFAAGALTITAT
jgi:hypothetical protein